NELTQRRKDAKVSRGILNFAALRLCVRHQRVSPRVMMTGLYCFSFLTRQQQSESKEFLSFDGHQSLLAQADGLILAP
ncbi:MAG: hypothetical protein ACK5ZM_00670, partial [bacterium]